MVSKNENQTEIQQPVSLFFQEKVKVVENVDQENYEETPIEGFGRTMLYKLGWKENTAIGRTNKGLVKPIELIPRQKGLGLGAIPLDPSKNPKAQNEDKSKTNYCGTKVRITHGQHSGLKGILIDYIEDLNKYLEENEYVDVQLKLNDLVVKVKSSHVRVRKEDKNEKKEKKREKNENDKIDKKDKKDKKEKKNKPLKWVIPHIKVRIISTKAFGGKYYNTKGIVSDILDSCTFSVVTFDGQVHNEFREKDVETVIPKLNEDVIVLKGENKGESGKLIGRDKKKDKVLVQLHTDLNIVTLTQDDICEVCK